MRDEDVELFAPSWMKDPAAGPELITVRSDLIARLNRVISEELTRQATPGFAGGCRTRYADGRSRTPDGYATQRFIQALTRCPLATEARHAGRKSDYPRNISHL